MNKNKLILALLILFTSQTYAQLEEVFAARDDAQTYLNHYLSPVMNGLMYNLNNGWYHTGKTHDKWGFDLTLTASASIIPEAEKMFVFDAAEYNYMSISSGSNELPTAAGSETSTVLMATNDDGDSVTFDALQGVGDKWPSNFFIPVSVPTPMIQAGVGIPSGTDVKLRYFPKTTNEELAYSLLGIGIQHDLTQHLQFLDKIPTLHISALGSFTQAQLTYTPTESPVEGEGQRMEMKVGTYTLQVIGDIDLKLVNFYLGMGYTGGATNIDALGTYQYDYDENGSFEADETVTDPMHLNFEINGFKTTAGVRFNFGPVRFFADYTLQKYPAIATGLALSLR
jgi:hypothetical protein